MCSQTADDSLRAEQTPYLDSSLVLWWAHAVLGSGFADDGSALLSAGSGGGARAPVHLQRRTSQSCVVYAMCMLHICAPSGSVEAHDCATSSIVCGG